MRLVTTLATLCIAGSLVTGCTEERAADDLHHSEVAPTFTDAGERIPVGGGRVEQNGVQVDAPPGALASEVEVSVGQVVGRIDTGFARERFGRPVRITHSRPLAGAVTLPWPAAGLTKAQARRAALVRWDDSARAWTPSDEPVRYEHGNLVARVARFSTVDWWTDFGQALGEVVGDRAEPPTCSAPVPRWVRSTVASDGGVRAAAAQMCFESTDGGRVARVRVVNNRTYAQRLTITGGVAGWSHVEFPNDGFSIDHLAYSAFHTALDRGGSVLIPPGEEVVADLARPSQPGSVFVEGKVGTEWGTVFADVVRYALGNASIGGTENPVLDAWVQALYECGGKQLALRHPEGTSAVIDAVVDVAGDCRAEIDRRDSEFGLRFEQLSRTLIAKSRLTAKAAVEANRAVEHLGRVFAVLQVGEVVTYLSDQFGQQVVGALPWSISARGTPPVLGRWTASCRSLLDDSSNLFKNLYLQDAFADTSRDLWEFPGWADAATKAVVPLKRCDEAYRTGLAAFLPTDWAQPKSAEAPARAILALSPALPTGSVPVLGDVKESSIDGTTPVGFGTAEPSEIAVTANTKPYESITWSGWGDATAYGSGKICSANGVTCRTKTFEATDLGTCAGVRAYRMLTEFDRPWDEEVVIIRGCRAVG